MADSVTQYLRSIRQNLEAGLATERTHYSALGRLLEDSAPHVKAITEPKRIACGAPDFVVLRDGLMVGHIEAKDVGVSLDEVERSEQLLRYRRSLQSLMLTNFIEFRWYVDGELRRSVDLARFAARSSLKRVKDGGKKVAGLIQDFLQHKPAPIASARELAERMARLTHLIREVIVTAFEQGEASDNLVGWREAFADVLVADLGLPENTGQFADVLAQTLAYGLFSARIRHEEGAFTRRHAQDLIPGTNPFLRDLFYYITGPQLDSEPYAGLVEDLVQILSLAEMDAVLEDFGTRTHQEDPIVHFYETFLSAYDPDLRELRGVYYTQMPVVSFIVRAVDYLLTSRFGLTQGLADTTKTTIANTDPGQRVKGKPSQVRRTSEIHKVLVLDPAVGTATFLYGVIDLIRGRFMQSGNAGMWSSYVREHLLPRIFGFELLMAPYAVAHFKLALQLAGHDLPAEQRAAWAYDFAGNDRIGIYLTNTLEGPHEFSGKPLFTQFLARESAAADAIKRDLPIMVVLGNPPYSGHSANKGPWIDDLLHGKLPSGERGTSYYEVDGRPLGERNTKWLQDDYVKFIRFGQWRIAQSGSGILAYICNNGYLENVTFRGMRQSLMETFTEIFILDLHGSARTKETAPDGSVDENVFDIIKSVAIGIFVKEPGKSGPATVYHADVWGKRDAKFELLLGSSLEQLNWEKLEPRSPFFMFLPRNTDFLSEYQSGCSVSHVFPIRSMGITTGRDAFAVSIDRGELEGRVLDLASAKSDEDIRYQYSLRDSSSFSLDAARTWARTPDAYAAIEPLDYRCFDRRWMMFTSAVLARDRSEVSQHLLNHDNLALVSFRAIRELPWQHAFITRGVVAKEYISSLDNCYMSPLYLYPEDDSMKLFDTSALSAWRPDPKHGDRAPNIAPAFISALEVKLRLPFAPHKENPGCDAAFGPGDILRYIYAILYSPTYRERYVVSLKSDFPRIPLTSDPDLFWMLVSLGDELVRMHLLEHPKVQALITKYPVPGNNQVAAKGGYPKYTPPAPDRDIDGRVYISKAQYFEGVPEDVWEFQIGGYQVLDKWLKGRRGRMLTFDDLMHYQSVVVALVETIRLMEQIDAAISSWPLE